MMTGTPRPGASYAKTLLNIVGLVCPWAGALSSIGTTLYDMVSICSISLMPMTLKQLSHGLPQSMTVATV